MTRRKPGPKKRAVAPSDASEDRFQHLLRAYVDAPAGLAQRALGGDAAELRRLCAFGAFHLHRLSDDAESPFDRACFDGLAAALEAIGNGSRPDEAFGLDRPSDAVPGAGAQWAATFWVRNVAAHVDQASHALRGQSLPESRRARNVALDGALATASRLATWTDALPPPLVAELVAMVPPTAKRIAQKDAVAIAAKLVARGPGVSEFHGTRRKPTETEALESYRALIVKGEHSRE